MTSVELKFPFFLNSFPISLFCSLLASGKGLYSLDSVFKLLSVYYGTLIDALEDTGYEVGTNLFGAPVCFLFVYDVHSYHFFKV